MPNAQFSRPVAGFCNLSWSEHDLRCGTRSYACRNQIREIRGQVSNERISIDGLEQVNSMVSNIAQLNGRVLRDLTLDAETVRMDFVWTEVRRKRGLVEGPWIEYALQQLRDQARPGH